MIAVAGGHREGFDLRAVPRSTPSRPTTNALVETHAQRMREVGECIGVGDRLDPEVVLQQGQEREVEVEMVGGVGAQHGDDRGHARRDPGVVPLGPQREVVGPWIELEEAA